MLFFAFLLIMFASMAWLISWGMVLLIFYPKRPIVLLGFHWEAPIRHFLIKLDWDSILPKEQLTNQLNILMPVIEDKLDYFFRNRLTEKLPMIAMFIGDKTIQQLKEVFMEELRSMFPDLMAAFSSNLQKEWIAKLDQTYLNVLQKKLLEATAPLRTIALFIGLIWGAITYAIYCFISHA